MAGSRYHWSGTGFKHNPASMLLARMHLSDDFPDVIYKREDWPGWPPDPGFITFTRWRESITAMAAWEPYDLEILQGGQVGTVLVIPVWPELWRHLKTGQTLHWLSLPFSAQILEPLKQENAE